MKTELRFCPSCGKEANYQILTVSDSAVLRENSHAVLWENSHAVLWGNSHAELRENSHAVLWDNSHAELRDNSHAELRDNSHAELWGNSHAETKSPYASMVLRSSASKGTGNCIGHKPLTAREWLTACSVPIKKGKVILYKSVEKDFTTRNGISFKPGTTHQAPDWDADFQGECGQGIHYCPTVGQTRTFRDAGIYVACEVAVKDLAGLPAHAQYPDKIRGKGGKSLYQVDANGKRLNAPSRDSKGRFIKREL